MEEVLLPPREKLRIIVAFSPIDDGQTVAEAGEGDDYDLDSQVIALNLLVYHGRGSEVMQRMIFRSAWLHPLTSKAI